MKLPNGHLAVVDLVKLRDYSLSPTHAEGKHKARVFRAALGLTESDASWRRDQLLRVAAEAECEPSRITDHGRRYVIDAVLERTGRLAKVRAVWNVRPGEVFPRLITCFVLTG